MEDKGTRYDQKLEFTGTILSQPPGNLRAEMKIGPAAEVWVVSDGAQAWTYTPRTKRYRKDLSPTPTTTNLGNLDPSPLLGVVLTGLQSAQLAPDEEVTIEDAHIHCYVVSANYEASQAESSVSPRVTLWIDQMNYVVLRRRIIVSVRNPQLPEPLERTLEFALTKLTSAPPVTGNEFAFTPPEGAIEMGNPQSALKVGSIVQGQ